MKGTKVFAILIMALPLLFGSCRSSKNVTDLGTKNTLPESVGLNKNLEDLSTKRLSTDFVTSKIKFSAEVGNQTVSLTGNLKMKRNDVIRLQLMAFGFVEAARLEFTKEYVLIMDRINKQYLKVPYSHLDFLRTNGINFHSLQALFWNELFLPGHQQINASMLNEFQSSVDGDNLILQYQKEKLSYKWLLNSEGKEIKMTNIAYSDPINGTTQLNWDYDDFKPFSNSQFPTKNNLRLILPNKQISIQLNMNYLGNDTDWETRTVISGKYREVSIDDILRRFLAL